MSRLRQQVDQIDLKILKLLQQRTKLAAQIGEAKRRHQADIYVPERERDVLAHLARQSRGTPPANALMAIYREILSSSRAEQGQAEIGLLSASASDILLPARGYFGACDKFSQKKTWTELAEGIEKRTLALALLSGDDLARVLQKTLWRRQFFQRFTVVGELPSMQVRHPLARRIFVVMRRGKGAALEANRILILIKCKSLVNAVKCLLLAMPECTIHAEQLALSAKPARGGGVEGLVRLRLAQSIDGIHATSQLLAARQASETSFSILGIYLSTEDYGG